MQEVVKATWHLGALENKLKEMISSGYRIVTICSIRDGYGCLIEYLIVVEKPA